MSIYINTNGRSMAINGLDLKDYMINKGIDVHTNHHNIEDIENGCCACMINLTDFNNKNINLRSGIDIGLANWFNLFTLLVVDPSNGELKDELLSLGININIFSEEIIKAHLDKILETIIKFRSDIEGFRPESLDARKKARKMLCKTMAEAFDTSGNLELMKYAERQLANR